MPDASDSSRQRVRDTIEVAARRRICVLAFHHSALAACAFFSGFALLLLAGTQILDWRWLAALVAFGFGLAAWRVRRQLLSRYAVAQLVDRQLRLSDSLSTAWFLLGQPAAPQPALAAAQIEQAAKSAHQVKPAAVFPFVWQRTWLLALALAAVTFGLFAVRYLRTNSLDLKQALVPIHLPSLAEVWERVRASGHPSAESRHPLTASRLDPRRPFEPGRADDPQNSVMQKQAGVSQTASSASERASAPSLDGPKKQDSAGPSNQKSSSEKRSGSDPGTKPGDSQSQQGSQTDRPNVHENANHGPEQNLMDRMKDALSGMMAKVRPHDPGTNDPKRSPQNPNRDDQTASNQNAQNSQTERDRRRSSDDQQGQGRQQNGQGQPAAQATEKSPGTQSQASNDNADRKGSDAHSGIGRQDGAKTMREAEQLHAMGKLQEIIGKRSADLTGDMTVEARSNHQQLQTQYSGRVASHTDLGREIDRDDVPVALQQYVREYMERVRKQAGGQ